MEKIDKITQMRIDTLHPIIREEVRDLVKRCNEQLTGTAQIRIVQGFRTFQEQNQLYAKGRTKKGPKVTNASGGQSLHNYGLAIDFALLLDDKTVSWDTNKDYDGDLGSDWMEIIRIYQSAGYESGGFWTFKDWPHIQKKGYNWRTLLEKYNEGQTFVENGIKYVKL